MQDYNIHIGRTLSIMIQRGQFSDYDNDEIFFDVKGLDSDGINIIGLD